MKANSKSISRQGSQLKLKTDSREQNQPSTKEPLRRVSSSFKLNSKTQDSNLQRQSNKTQTSQEGFYSSNRNIKVQNQSKATILQGMSRKVIGWTQLDKVKYQLTIEKRLRESLERENQMLKKEINFLNNFGTSMRTSVNSKKGNEDNQLSNKEKILSRLNKKREGVTTIEKDNDSTGLYSGKMKTSEQKINEMYEEYAKKRIAPILSIVYEVANSYFSEFQQNYSKLIVLFNQSKGLQKTGLYEKMEDLLFLFQVPILYKERPKDLMKSVSKERLKSKKSSLDASFNKKGEVHEKGTKKIKDKRS